VERDSGNQKKGFGLFLEDGCRKDDFIIEYMGRVTKKHDGNYSMKINPPEFKGKRKKGVDTVNINANIDGGLAKYINHSCDPNCKLIEWYVEGLPRLCFFAKREIKKGTELTFNYNLIKERGKGMKCFCEGKKCSGYIEK
jgi:SET domain-containing protein